MDPNYTVLYIISNTMLEDNTAKEVEYIPTAVLDCPISLFDPEAVAGRQGRKRDSRFVKDVARQYD